MTIRTLGRVATLALPLLAACAKDQTVAGPDLSNNRGIFERYVAIGTSISAGLQSGGINDSTQRLAFPHFVAQAAGAPFTYPRLAGRGCPAPLVNNVTGQRVGNQPPNQPCDLRATPAAPYVNNLGVPGLEIRDLFSQVGSPLSTYERLATFFLGGRTPIRAVMEARPTFMTVELGSNEVLGAPLASNDPGNLDSLPPLPIVQQNYTRFLDSLVRLGTKAVLFTAPDPTGIPFFSTGTTYWCLGTGNCPGIPRQFPANVTVANSCAPGTAVPGAKGDSILVPWTIGVAGILRASQPPFTPFTLDCAVDAQAVQPDEFAAIRTYVVNLNNFILAQANARGFGVVDANAIFQRLRQTGQVPPFPDLSQVATGGSVRFGLYFSLDGFHPASPTHRVVADSAIAVVNRWYNTRLPFVGP